MDTLTIILRLMKDNNCDNLQLAEALGLNRQVVTDWKAGRSKSYNKYLYQIADYFNVSVDYLLGKEKNSPENSEEFEESVAFNRNGKRVVYKISKDKIDLLETLVKNLKDQDDPDL